MPHSSWASRAAHSSNNSASARSMIVGDTSSQQRAERKAMVGAVAAESRRCTRRRTCSPRAMLSPRLTGMPRHLGADSGRRPLAGAECLWLGAATSKLRWAAAVGLWRHFRPLCAHSYCALPLLRATPAALYAVLQPLRELPQPATTTRARPVHHRHPGH